MPWKATATLGVLLLLLGAPVANGAPPAGEDETLLDLDEPVHTAYGDEPGDLVPVDTSQLPFDEGLIEDQHPVHPYYTWYTLTAELFDLAEAYPGITNLYSAGQSHLGFDLWVLEIADFDDPDKVPLDEREVVYLDGGHHANEDLGVTMTMLWAQFLTGEHDTNETVEWIVENRHTVLVPLVNADGNHLNNRENANLVDLNRNYPQGWGQVEGDTSGPHPLSEPETRTVYELLHAYEPDYVNSFHTGIELMLYPWGYTDELPPDEQVYRTICEEIGEPDPDFCGTVNHAIYPAGGGMIESAYGHVGSIAYSYELSEEQSMPASLEDPRERMDRYWQGVEHAFLNVEKYGAHPTLTIQDLQGAPGEAITLTASIQNEGYGNLTDAEVTLSFPGASEDTVPTGFLAPNETTTVTLETRLQEGIDVDEIELTLTYEERAQASPTEQRSVIIPANLTQDGIEILQAGDVATSQADEDETSSVSVPGLVATLGAFGVALGALRAGRG